MYKRQQQGYEIDLLNVNRDGKADLAHLRELLRKDTTVSYTHLDVYKRQCLPCPVAADPPSAGT